MRVTALSLLPFVTSLWPCCTIFTLAFIPPTSTFTSKNTRISTLSLQASATSTTGSSKVQDQGVDKFEQWFQQATSTSSSSSSSNNKNDSQNTSMKYLRHNLFSNGRGLEFIGKSKLDVVGNGKPIITLPKELVLQSEIMNKEELDSIADDWDVNLSLQLLRECKLGEQSLLYGYCSLLTQGQDFNAAKPCPSSTAPDALRNWSVDEKELLLSSKRGERLLRVEEKQSQEWKDKYAALSKNYRDEFTFEQFKWAMEAVTSRAFKGDFSGQDALKQVSNALLPFAAGALALNYIGNNPFGANEDITFVLLLVACAPVTLNFLSDAFSGKKLDAVMLPFIDSANHKESARSDIAFDPLSGSFTVCVEGNTCFEKDSGLNQFYISYGEKRDTELLLNYGFLNGMKENYESQEERRRLLADIFNSRSLQ